MVNASTDGTRFIWCAQVLVHIHGVPALQRCYTVAMIRMRTPVQGNAWLWQFV